MTPCVDCGAETHPVETPRCPACNKLQPLPRSASFFDVMGVATSYALTDAALDAAFRQRSMAVHPDRFARASDRERRTAVERTAALNEAYRVLKHPESRALYLLKRAGVALDANTDPALLMELMEAREEADGSPALRQALLQKTAAEKDALHARLSSEFSELEQAGALLDGARLKPVAGTVMRIRYLTRLWEDLQGLREHGPGAPL